MSASLLTRMCAGPTSSACFSYDRGHGVSACSRHTALVISAPSKGDVFSSGHAGATWLSREASPQHWWPSHQSRNSGLLVSAVAAEFETIQQPDAAASAGIDRQTAANALLKLLSPEARKQASVAAEELSSGAGVGMVATRDVRPGALLLAVPFSLVLETARDETDDASTSGEAKPWSANMARMLLDTATPPSSAAEAAASAPDTEAGTQHDQQQAARQHWVAALPEHVPLAFAYASEAELRGVGDEGLVDEALGVRQLMLDSFEGSAGGHSLEAWRWAWSCAHSRSFKDGAGGHLIVPGIDMANHAFAPSASVRLIRDPDRCQGHTAMADVCDPDLLPPGEARVELVAGDAGLRKGEEVTISYGPWPDDVYALFYGFLPGQPPQSAGARSPDQAAADAVAQQQPIGNPHQKIVLFADVRHLAAFATVQFGPADADDAQLTSWAEAIAQELIATVGDNCQRLFMTPVGFDERLAMAAQQLLRTHVVPLGWPAEAGDDSAMQQALQPSDILAARIAQMQAAADEAADAEPQEVAVPSYMEAVLQCAAERRALLRGALHALWGW